jgi:hypothetical protein
MPGKPRPRTFTENQQVVLPQTACRWCRLEIPTDVTTCPVCCPRCGTKHEPGAPRCAACRGFLPGNQAARTHGLSARHVPADLRMDADQLKDNIVSDLGGLENLSALEISYVRKIADTEVMLRLLLHSMVNGGVLTSGGKVRDVYPAFLAGIDRFDRLAQRIGLKRRQKDAGQALRDWWDKHSQPVTEEPAQERVE